MLKAISVTRACVAVLGFLLFSLGGAVKALAERSPVALPPGVKAVWDMDRAYRETTPTRERICINGLWQWQPADGPAEQVPEENWGYFKVPGSWPGITDYMQKDSQTLHRHPAWQGVNLRDVTMAWHQREIEVPVQWTGRRLAICAEYVNSYAAVYVDGLKAGEILFPAGEVDVTSLCRPGDKHVLSVLVAALPLKSVMLSYSDSATAREVRGSVARRGLCGDMFLESTPLEARLADVKVETSVDSWEITSRVSLENMKAGVSHSLTARITDQGREVKAFKPVVFEASQLRSNQVTFTEPWHPKKLWDIHTPQNTYELEVSLLNVTGEVLDVFPAVSFGFRELAIDGRDFKLNGTRVFLSAVPLDNAQVGAALATYEAAYESLKRLRSFGINMVYTHNYGCQPGTHLSFAEILRAADDLGMLVAFSMPHFSHYDWEAPDADANNGYARHAAFYARVAQNHPSVVMYATSHNACGYSEDMIPYMIDGLQDKRDRWAQNNMKKALRAESIIKRLDASRIVYHHAGGDLGGMHTSNFYPNFVPPQELSDWFGHWATQGVKPVFLCEYGAPFAWDWAMYRGWYRDKREFGSAVVPWEFCLAEWNAQFFGDRAFEISDMEKKNLRWEADQFKSGRLWHRWDYPHALGSTDFIEREAVFETYFQDNWRAFRTWGLSANSPWEHRLLYKLRPGMARNQRQVFEVDWENLQRPGFSPDYLAERYERMDLAYKPSDWIATAGGEALIRNNLPLLAYIGGKPGAFTSKDHLFVAGETVGKQLIVINNSRVPVNADCSWSLALPRPVHGQGQVSLETGQQARLPMSFHLPAGIKPGEYRLSMKTVFDTGQTQQDEFVIHVMARAARPRMTGKVAVFDPKGRTTEWLKDLGISFDSVDAKTNMTAYDILIVGKAALTVDGPAPDMGPVRDGLKVLMFEQTSDVLEKRFGFRVAEYGLRQVFARVPDHPALAGLKPEHLKNWSGQATLLESQLTYELNAKFNGVPTVDWCGIPVPRAWRCGCQGNVASVLIEKPARGDFLPIVDGGFSLQYSPLLAYHEGQGMVLFCQMDVTRRTQTDPAAETLATNLLKYVNTWKPSTPLEAVYVGEPAGKAHLQAAGVRLGSFDGSDLTLDQVLIIGPESSNPAVNRDRVERFLKAGGRLLAVGLTQEDVDAVLPFTVSIYSAEHISSTFDPPGSNSPLTGIGPADVHNRAPRVIPLVSEGATIAGNGVLAVAPGDQVVFCQLAPWHFKYENNFGLKRTFRRTSFLLTRLLSNLRVRFETPLLKRLSTPPENNESNRCLQGLYLDQPEEWDDPYRFFRW